MSFTIPRDHHRDRREKGEQVYREASQALTELIQPRWGGALAVSHLSHSGGIEAVIAEPIATRTGKVLPVRLLGADRLQEFSRE